MRSYSWSLFAGFALACGGSAFTSINDNGDGGSTGNGNTGNDGATAGVLSRAGRSGVGGKTSNGGSSNTAGSDSTAGTDNSGGAIDTGGTGTTGGVVGVAGDVGIGGDLVVGGSVSMAGTTGTAGTGPDPMPDTKCPMTEPMPGGACVDGLSCSFGTDVRTWCRPRATCQKGVWSVEPSTCKTIHSCQGEVTVGAGCDPQVAAGCVKNSTQYCECSMCQGVQCSPKPVWSCAAVVTGSGSCPKLAPNQGQSCSANSDCTYGSCGVGQPTNASCVDGFWSWQGENCPL